MGQFRFLSRLATAAAVVVGLAGVSTEAQAGLSISSVVGGGPVSGGNYVNFDDVTPLNTTPLTFSTGVRDQSGNLQSGTVTLTVSPDSQAVQGSVSGQYAAPFLSGGNGVLFQNPPADGQDSTTYITTGSTGFAGTASSSLDFSAFGSQTYLGILWGSVDNYNTLSFYNGSTLVGSITGTQVNAFANGDQGANGTYYVNINLTGGDSFTKVVATSTQYAFEFDNVAIATPEPTTVVMAFTGFGFLGLNEIRRRMRRKAS